MKRTTTVHNAFKKIFTKYYSLFPKTLARYISFKFTIMSLIAVTALTGLLFLFDFIDLLRKASSHPDVGMSIIFLIASCHTPYYLTYVFPFGILLGGMTCFARLSRSSELSVIRATGISTWQFLGFPTVCAFLLGIFVSTGLSPLSSLLYRQANILDQTYLHSGNDSFLSHQGSLWLYQNDTNHTSNKKSVIHIKNLYLSGNVLNANKISIFFLDNNFHFLSRIEAPSGTLFNHQWHFSQAFELNSTRPPLPLTNITLNSDLTVERIQNSSKPPDTFSFWSLPHYIKLLSQSGFSTIQYRLHFQALLALPLLASTMALVSAGFSIRTTRQGGVMRMISTGIVVGFILFTISKIAEQLGKSGALPPLLASWAPAGAGLCLAAALLLHMEDG